MELSVSLEGITAVAVRNPVGLFQNFAAGQGVTETYGVFRLLVVFHLTKNEIEERVYEF